MNETQNTFPRKLSAAEKEVLFCLLPADKSGYNYYREKIEKLFVIGSGRFGRTNLILGLENQKPDLSVSSTAVLATGIVETDKGTFDVVIHEEIDDEIEFDISNGDKLKELTEIKIIGYKTLSSWKPGNLSPFTQSEVREIIISANEYLLAISISEKRIWLYNYRTGINHLIPLTNFYNELMRVKNIRNPEIALKPKLFFEHLYKYSDDDLRNALINYDKYLNKFKLPSSVNFQNRKKKKSIFRIFKRGQN